MHAGAGPASAPSLVPLRKPGAFVQSLRARALQTEVAGKPGELRLHYRLLRDDDGLGAELPLGSCAVGFVLPKRLCKHAARRNLIRRIGREALRAWLSTRAEPPRNAVLVLRLVQKFDPMFASAQSAPLRKHLRGQIDDLLERAGRRLQSPPGPGAVAPP